MRNFKLYTLLFLLGLLSASGASGAPANVAILMASQSNQVVSIDKTSAEQGKITCVPQQDPQQQLWKCQDAYGNQYDNLVITLKSEIDRIKGKNGNLKRAGN